MYEKLPKLPFDYSAFDATFIDEKTMKCHYCKHHQGYLDKLKQASGFDASLPIEKLLVTSCDQDVQNQGGGFYNHALFWHMIAPCGGGPPKGDLLCAIQEKYCSFEKFKDEFTNLCASLFGSGWVWLVKHRDKHKLEIIQKANQNHPNIADCIPILGLDLWEHAYYLKYQNRRLEYVAAYWGHVNWDFCSEQYSGCEYFVS